MKILLANDHGAVELKQKVKLWLLNKRYEVTDLGIALSDTIDYPDKAKEACSVFLQGGYDFGILFCGTGIGMSISANKVKGIRCALVHDEFSATMAKAHNNANFLALGGRIQYTVDVTKIVAAFITATFEGGRHSNRLHKIDLLDKDCC